MTAMSADSVAALATAGVSGAVALIALVVVVVLTRRLHELRDMVRDLRSETVPLVRDARVVVDQAATEMLRVGDVLSSAEAVTETVDSASRLAYRAFANPVVKVLAFRTGVTSALRRLFSPRVRDGGSHRRARTQTAASFSARAASPAASAQPLQSNGQSQMPAKTMAHRRRRRSRADA